MSMVGQAYNKFLGQEGYSTRFDLSRDGRITLIDVAMFSPFYNRTCS